MNYFEHHIGDYDKNTSHLTACEDGMYSRMIRRYYDKEKPLDVDVNEVKRLMRARNKEERQAVDSILKEFFSLQEDGWHNKVCDEVLEKFMAGEPEREVKKANEDNRLKRHRAERAELFKIITDAGEHAPWNMGMAELRELVKRMQNLKPETPPETAPETRPATAPATLATATQSPDTRHQSYSVSKDTGAASVAEPAELTKQELWAAGKSLLSVAGMPTAQCGSFVGKLVKDYGDEIVVNAVRAAVVAQPADPAEYLKATCMGAAGQRAAKPGKHAGFQNLNYREGIAADGSFT